MSLPTILQDAKVSVLKNETCDEAYTETSVSGRVPLNELKILTLNLVDHINPKF